MCSKVRHFLHVVRLASALAANLLAELWDKTLAPSRVLPLGVFAGAMLTTLCTILHPSVQGRVHQIIPTYLLLASSVLAITAGYSCFERRWPNLCAMTLAGAGIGVGLQLVITDFCSAKHGRGKTMKYSAAHVALPDDALAFVPSRFLVGWTPKEGHAAALPEDSRGKVRHWPH